jgi:DNA invertase Pin-like site-specific DNA recombinase
VTGNPRLQFESWTGRSRITTSELREARDRMILSMLAAGFKPSEVARLLGVSQSLVYRTQGRYRVYAGAA